LATSTSAMRRRSRNPEETQRLGFEFAEQMSPGSVLSLSGDLGSGKTEFVKGLAKGLGVTDSVTSPTFTLVHEHTGGRLPLYHMDLFRIDEENDLDEFGFDDYLLSKGVCAIEWADKFRSRLPAEALHLRFEISKHDERIITW
jgi:tRNA threonylcarbamoyladenosine biosynthesis protein TsaE